jgi:F-type H+-transporting ATPase subunit b
MIQIDATFLVIFFIVWVLVFVLSKVFFKPVSKIRDEREGVILKNRNASQRALESYEQSIQEIERALKTAKASAEATKEGIELEALKEKSRLVAEVSLECRVQVEKAKEQLNEEIQRMKKGLESETEVLAERIERRLLN